MSIKHKYKFSAVLFLIAVVPLFSQKDSIKVIAEPEVNSSQNNSQKYQPTKKIRYYFQGDTNVTVIKKKNKYERIEYYKSGKIKSETELLVLLGADTTYNVYPQSKESIPEIEVDYKFTAVRSGKYLERYESGSIKIKGFYDINGYRDKEWCYYDEKGTLLRKEVWQNNVLIKK